jgi:hypothetical protein
MLTPSRPSLQVIHVSCGQRLAALAKNKVPPLWAQVGQSCGKHQLYCSLHWMLPPVGPGRSSQGTVPSHAGLVAPATVQSAAVSSTADVCRTLCSTSLWDICQGYTDSSCLCSPLHRGSTTRTLRCAPSTCPRSSPSWPMCQRSLGRQQGALLDAQDMASRVINSNHRQHCMRRKQLYMMQLGAWNIHSNNNRKNPASNEASNA